MAFEIFHGMKHRIRSKAIIRLSKSHLYFPADDAKRVHDLGEYVFLLWDQDTKMIAVKPVSKHPNAYKFSLRAHGAARLSVGIFVRYFSIFTPQLLKAEWIEKEHMFLLQPVTMAVEQSTSSEAEPAKHP